MPDKVESGKQTQSYAAVWLRYRRVDKSLRLQWENIQEHGWGWASVFFDKDEQEWRLLRWLLKLPNLNFIEYLRLEELSKKAGKKV